MKQMMTAMFLFSFAMACNQANGQYYPDFDHWLPHVEGAQTGFFNAGDDLTSKTKIDVLNGNGPTVNVTIKIYVDDVLRKTIGPTACPANSTTSFTSAETTHENATAVPHTIGAVVTFTDTQGQHLSTSSDTHYYSPNSGGVGGD